ncbi:MAG: glutathione S-transferase family protein [Gammaproteobacteria bacterium]
MIELYTYNTFNGQRASIMLEETGLPYTAHRIDLSAGEQHRPKFLELNPSGRIPVLVDYGDESRPFVLTQSVAIVQYLAEKTGLLLPQPVKERARLYEWMQFHAIDIGGSLFNAFYLQQICSTQYPEAAEELRDRAHQHYRHFDRRLAEHEYLAGDVYTIADIIALPAALAQETKLAEYEHLTRWLRQQKQRPAVQRGMAVPDRE